ncbi:MAG: 3-dehydroquinate synthase [Firmicutes bacterium]|nr:3-dehydroquinate synthase [Bacillota bacterium]
MKIIKIHQNDINSRLHIGSGILSRAGRILNEAGIDRALIITGSLVKNKFGHILEKSLAEKKIHHKFHTVPEGEEYKNLRTVQDIYDSLVSFNADRKTCIIAFGGGVVGDTAGFAAATFMRGIPLAIIPTTLLAQVDSSIGGKVGVDLPGGKNLAGAFYNPGIIITDTELLSTLPESEIRAGMAEIIKASIIGSPGLFNELRKNHFKTVFFKKGYILKIIKDTIEIKADVVKKDPFEKGLRAVLNLGHTLGHAIETHFSYTGYRHGEAISIGMVFAADIAHKLKILKEDFRDELIELLRLYELPFSLTGIEASELVKIMMIDKKRKGEGLTFVLPERIGKVRVVKNIEPVLVKKFLEKFILEGADEYV